MTAIENIPLKDIGGKDASLGDYHGKVRLVVNVASKCGLTKQYDALEKLYTRFRDQGFVVLGFPANNFAGQEPGTESEIQDFCKTTFDVDFPLFSKISVVGENQHPLYRELTAAAPQATAKPDSTMRNMLAERGLLASTRESDVLWNFEKFLVDRTGHVVARFAPDITPDDPLVVDAIQEALTVN